MLGVHILLLGALVSSTVTVTAFLPECPLLSLKFLESSIYSQNGEDGVISALLSIIGTTDRTYVEFGVENGTQCNTRNLRETRGFSGLLMDGSHNNETINLKKEYITVDNILALFQKYNVPSAFDILSVDLDMYDWWILERILNEGGYRPRILVVEVNPTLGHWDDAGAEAFSHFNTIPLVVHHPYHSSQTHWDHSRYFGANPKAFQRLGELYGYEMLYCESCSVNCFLVQRSELPISCLSPPPFDVAYPCYFHSNKDNSTSRGHAPDHSLKRNPVLLTDNILRKDIHYIHEIDMPKYIFNDSSIDFSDSSTPHIHTTNLQFVIYLLIHIALFLWFIFQCCRYC